MLLTTVCGHMKRQQQLITILLLGGVDTVGMLRKELLGHASVQYSQQLSLLLDPTISALKFFKFVLA